MTPLFGKKKPKTIAGQTAIAMKATKARKLRAMVYPQGGGSPYEQDVEPDDQGIFTLGQNGSLSYKVVNGSVCLGLDGVMRIVVHEGNPQTVNVAMLNGDSVMHPSVFHAAVNNNLLLQQADMERNRGLWKQAGTWGMIGIGIGVILMLMWQVKTTGSGMEEIKDALAGLHVASQGQDAAAAGHNALGG